MKHNYYLNQQFKKILKRIKFPTSTKLNFDTYMVLYQLATKSQWCDPEFKLVDFLSKRFDITKKIYAAYHDNGDIAENVEITQNAYLELLNAIFLKVALINQHNCCMEVRIKRFNVLFKALDIIKPNWLLPNSILGLDMESAWHSFLKDLWKTNNEPEITLPPRVSIQDDSTLKIIPLTVLFYEGPIARSYLTTLKELGLKPMKIIELIAAKDIATKKIVGKWLPKGLRLNYAATVQRNKIHYWPKNLLKTKSTFINAILTEVKKKLTFEKSTIDNAHALLPLSNYSDCIESLLIKGLDDKILHKKLLEEPCSAILYTGGGIMPKELLKLPHLKFLHIHPGFLPNIRGADCTLWSSLLTGYTSASCFYMSPGIDTGDIVKSCWLPALSFDVDITNIDLKSIYRIVYGFLDPWVRSYVLRDVIINNNRYNTMICFSQSNLDNTTFHFMHPRIQSASFQKLFKIN